MRYAYIAIGLLSFALAPPVAAAQGNLNSCYVSTLMDYVTGDIEISGDANPSPVDMCDVVMISNFQVTFPLDIVSHPAIQGYNAGLWDGVVPVPVDILLEIKATNASPTTRSISWPAELALEIVDPTPGFPGDESIVPGNATVDLPTFGWTPTGGDIVIELSQGVFTILGGGASAVCEPMFLPADPFKIVAVTFPSCTRGGTCNDQGDCDICGNCDCDPGYTGTYCQTPTCTRVDTCDDHGDCEAGECVCDDGYTGADCSIATCTPGANCNGAPVGIADAYTRIVCTSDPVPCADTGALTVLDGSTLTFQDLDLPVFDQGSVNLGLTVGGMAVPTIQPPDPELSSFVSVPNPTSPMSATFRVEYLSDAPGTLNLLGLGDAVCPPDEPNDPVGLCAPQLGEPWNAPWDATYVTTDATISGSLVDDGPGTLPTVVNGAPVTYAIDGATVCNVDFGRTDCFGTAYLNAFLGFSTTPGTEVPVAVSQIYVDPSDPTGETVIPVNIGIKYAQIDAPEPPEPVFTTVVTTSEAAGTISSDYKIDGLGFTPVFFDITTNGEVTGNVTVCVEYQEPSIDECNLRLLHNDNGGDNVFVDVTEELPEDDVDCPFDAGQTCLTNGWCINPTSNQVCGRTIDGLSPFTIGEDVGNKAPAIETVNVALVPEAVGQPVTAAVSFCDPDLNQILEIKVEWGDDQVSDRAAAAEACDPYQQVEVTHAYAEAGVYIVKVTVSDNDGASDSQAFQFAVIYDPTGGFVTGGGWIDSPEGAYTDDLLLTGKANFGFVSKYKKGANLPTGNTEFQFKAGYLNFKSTSYDWLVIAGTKAKFKGDGTINGDGSFGFMLSAVDGDDDTFRIKIWDKENADVVVYDNQMGEADDADATTALGGGSIVIHKAK